MLDGVGDGRRPEHRSQGKTFTPPRRSFQSRRPSPSWRGKCALQPSRCTHLSPAPAFAIRRAHALLHPPQPIRNPHRARNACHRQRRRTAVPVAGVAGRADLRRDDRGGRRRHCGAAARPAAADRAHHPDDARTVAGFDGVAGDDQEPQRLSGDHRAVGRGDLLRHLRLKLLPAAESTAGTAPRRYWPAVPARCRR